MADDTSNIPTTGEIRDLFAQASQQDLEEAESAFDRWFAQLVADVYEQGKKEGQASAEG